MFQLSPTTLTLNLVFNIGAPTQNSPFCHFSPSEEEEPLPKIPKMDTLDYFSRMYCTLDEF